MAQEATYAAQSGGVLINAPEMQSMEIEGPFSYHLQAEGWQITMQAAGKVSFHFRANMRRMDFTVLEGDQVVRSGNDILIVRTHETEAYRGMRSPGSYVPSRAGTGSQLARSSTRQMGSPLASDVEEMVRAAETKTTQEGS